MLKVEQLLLRSVRDRDDANTEDKKMTADTDYYHTNGDCQLRTNYEDESDEF